MLTEKYKKDLITIVDGYEGIGGYDPNTKKYYPYQGKADKQGLKTLYRGHLMSQEDISSGRYKNGITKEEGERIFKYDLLAREDRVFAKLNPENERHAVAQISSLYNCPSMWEWSNSPRKLYTEYRQLPTNNSMKSVRLKQTCNYMMMYHNSNGKAQLGLYRRRGTEVLYMLTGELLFGNKGYTEEVKLFKRLKELGVDLQHMKKFRDLDPIRKIIGV